jgi:hypothetical protein
MFMYNSLPTFFQPIESIARHQFYANLVQTAVLITIAEREAAESDAALRGLSFPKRNSLELRCNYHQDGLYVPRFEAIALQRWKSLTYKQVADSPDFERWKEAISGRSGHAETAWNILRTRATSTRRRDRNLEIGV